MEPKFPQPPKRIIGKHSEYIKQQYDNLVSEKGLRIQYPEIFKAELEKTHEEQVLISAVSMELTKMKQKFFKDEIPPVPMDHVIKLPVNFNSPNLSDLSQKGVHALTISPQNYVVYKEADNMSVLVHILAHEFTHMQGHLADQVDGGVDQREVRIAPYRVGLEVESRDFKERRFGVLNEIITEEIARRVQTPVVEMFGHEKERLQKVNKYNEQLIEKGYEHIVDHDKIMNVVNTHRSVEYQETQTYGYPKETEAFKHFINKISEKLGLDKDKVFDIFCEAYFTGHLLSLAHLYDDAFGEGTFKKFTKVDSIDQNSNSTKDGFSEASRRVQALMYSLCESEK